MELILDLPLATHQREQASRVRLCRRWTRDIHHDYGSCLARLFHDDLPLEQKNLGKARPRIIADEYVTGLRLSLLDAPILVSTMVVAVCCASAREYGQRPSQSRPVTAEDGMECYRTRE
jgi:hypothetical protein